VPIHTKNEVLSISKNWTATPNIFFEQLQGITINRQYPLPMVFLLLGLSLLNLTAASGTERMASAESLPAPSAGQLQAGFEVFDGNRATTEIHVFNRQTKSLADAATRME